MNPQTNEVQYIGINWYVPLTFQDWDNDLPSKSERPVLAASSIVSLAFKLTLTRASITIESESPTLHYTASRVHIRPTYLSDGRRMSAKTLRIPSAHARGRGEGKMYMIHEHLFRKGYASAFGLASSCPVVRQGLTMSDEPLSPASPLDKFSRVGRRFYASSILSIISQGGRASRSD